VHLSFWAKAGVVLGAFLIDVALTFVVPALALNDRSVKAAFRLGWSTTKSTWPTNGWYLFAPGVTIVAFAAVIPDSVVSNGVYVGIGIASSLFSLLFKGAIVAFFVRSVEPASLDGSAYSQIGRL
jgi:membrane-anchored glycerophosphoryl diester phosphodiesterase (GDPDase)